MRQSAGSTRSLGNYSTTQAGQVLRPEISIPRDATRLLVSYGFNELNFRRISLGLHAFNERALKSYLKVGFVLEGRERGAFFRDGVRYDGLLMGLLREEWLAGQAAK